MTLVPYKKVLFWLVSERVLSGLVSFFTLFAIIGGLYGYFSTQQDKRVEKSFEFYKTFRTELRDDWALLLARWNAVAPTARTLLDQRRDDELTALSISLIDDERSQNAFNRLLDFFGEFSSCVEHHLCDNNSGVALLQEKASEFVGAYGPYIGVLRKDHGEGVGRGAYKIASMTREYWITALLF